MNPTTTIKVEDEILKIIENAKSFFKNKNIPLYQSLNISPEKIEDLYQKASAFYYAEKYQQAAALFDSLILYNHQDRNHWIGFAASYQMLKNHEKSINGYSKAFRLDARDPTPLVHLFECYFDLKDYPRAIATLESIILITNNRPEYLDLKIDAESLKKNLNKNGTYQTMPTLIPF